MTKKFLFLREIQVKELAAGRNPVIKSKARSNISQSKKKMNELGDFKHGSFFK
jgi:hypothetical protein